MVVSGVFIGSFIGVIFGPFPFPVQDKGCPSGNTLFGIVIKVNQILWPPRCKLLKVGNFKNEFGKLYIEEQWRASTSFQWVTNVCWCCFRCKEIKSLPGKSFPFIIFNLVAFYSSFKQMCGVSWVSMTVEKHPNPNPTLNEENGNFAQFVSTKLSIFEGELILRLGFSAKETIQFDGWRLIGFV